MLIVRKNVKYYFYVFTLYNYCKWAKISYSNIKWSIKYYLKKHNNKYNMDNVIPFVVLKYLRLRERRIKKCVFLNVLNHQIDLKEVSMKLELSVSSINQVRRYGFSLQQAILIVHFLSDKIINDKKSISKNRTIELKNAINTNLFPSELHFLFCCYYLNYEMLDKIFDCINYKYQFVLSKLALEMDVDVKEQLNDLYQEIDFMVWNLIKNKKIVMDNSNQIWKFIYKSTIHKVKRRMYQLSLEQRVKHLEDKYFEDKEFIDCIYIQKDTEILNMVQS